MGPKRRNALGDLCTARNISALRGCIRDQPAGTGNACHVDLRFATASGHLRLGTDLHATIYRYGARRPRAPRPHPRTPCCAPTPAPVSRATMAVSIDVLVLIGFACESLLYGACQPGFTLHPATRLTCVRVCRRVLRAVSGVALCSVLHLEVAGRRQDGRGPPLVLVRRVHAALCTGVQSLLHVPGEPTYGRFQPWTSLTFASPFCRAPRV